MSTSFQSLIIDQHRPTCRQVQTMLKSINGTTKTTKTCKNVWKRLSNKPKSFDLIIINLTQTKDCGLTLIAQIKKDIRFASIPIIIFTEDDSFQLIKDAGRDGAHYHTQKPIERKSFLLLVKSALFDHSPVKNLKECLRCADNALLLLQQGSFYLRNFYDVDDIAQMISKKAKDPLGCARAITELGYNAIEHGVLAISYDQKGKLIKDGVWQKTIAILLKRPENKHRHAIISFFTTSDTLEISIQDPGPGFNWKEYLHFSPERASHIHGRGIALTNILQTIQIQYIGDGNIVKIITKIA